MRSHYPPFIRRGVRPSHRRALLRPELAGEYRPQLDLWIVRLLLLAKLDPEDCAQECVLTAIGLPQLKDCKLYGPKATRVLKQRLAELETTPIGRTGRLYHNLERLEAYLGLNRVEQDLLAFAALVQRERPLAALAEMVAVDNSSAVVELLAQVIGLDEAEARRALREDGVLCSAGFLRLDAMVGQSLKDTLDLLDGLDNALLGDHDDLATMFRKYFRPAPSPRLTLDDFPYLQDELLGLRRLVQGACRRAAPGVNILLYGAPGTGKTELVRALAAACGAALFEVGFESGEEEPPHSLHPAQGRSRFRAYQLSQRMLAHKQDSLILFDEVTDVFPETDLSFLGKGAGSGHNKAWTNHILETNPVPAFWLSNRIGHMDPAFLRRFDYALELRIPPQSIRRGMLQKSLGDLPLPQDWMERIAACEDLTPAHIEQLAKVARLMDLDDPDMAERIVTGVLQNNLKALGSAATLHSSGRSQPVRYSLEFLNPSEDLPALLAGLKQQPRGRLCFYGPPGSGKTELAHHIAEQLDRPLLKKVASELLSMWVGGTEQNLAAMFQQARAERAVLLLDEADSFLQDRRTAHHSWEVTQVNELLVQMEAFEGLFICSTNLMEALDFAVLRRFDVKVRFDFLRPDQAWRMFLLLVQELKAAPAEPGSLASLQPRVSRLTNVTPGDFATIRRHARFMDPTYPVESLLATLEKECHAKLRGHKPIAGSCLSG